MFGFVGQTPKMDNIQVYDTYIKIVPPLKRIGEILLKTLEFFGWKHVGMIGGCADTNTWDNVDALWKSVEKQLKAEVTVTAGIKFDTSDPELSQRNLQIISKVARGKSIVILIFQLLQYLGGVYTVKTCKITKYIALMPSWLVKAISWHKMSDINLQFNCYNIKVLDKCALFSSPIPYCAGYVGHPFDFKICCVITMYSFCICITALKVRL